jgi:GNAT superfamily N-acetyltransferase
LTGAEEANQFTAPEPLEARHDLSTFGCGAPVLDDSLRRRALPNQISGVSRTYVLTGEKLVVGYYTLAAGAIAVDEAPGRVRRNMLDPIPMTVLGRLAIDQTCQGRGLGRLLLRDAILRTLQAAEMIGIRGLLVHALSPAAKRFYESSGFRESPANPMTLMVSFVRCHCRNRRRIRAAVAQTVARQSAS